MKKIFILSLLILSIWSISASTVSAQYPWSNGLVTCGKEADATKAATSCDFTALIALINTIIKYLIFIAMPLAAIMFAYAGWIYLSAGGDTGKVTKAKTIFINVGIGFLLVLGAWLIFDYIAKTFLTNGYNSFLK